MGGKHERMNPRGPVGGRKGPGDVLAEKYRGRRGMYKPRRRKGFTMARLESDHQRAEAVFDEEESQLICVLFMHGKCYPSVLCWEEVAPTLEAVGILDAIFEANDFIQGLADKAHGWLRYIPFHSLCMRAEHTLEIKEFVQHHMEASGAG